MDHPPFPATRVLSRSSPIFFTAALVLLILCGPTSSCLAQAGLTNVIAGTIAVPGQRDVYSFNLAASTRFYFDSLTNVPNLQWSLSGPQGAVISDRSFASSDAQSVSDPTVLLPAGDYSITIQDPSAATNGYAFRWVNLAEATLLVPGTVVTNTLSPANKSDFYQFTASAGDLYYFHQIARVGLPRTWWRLLDPYGNQVFSQGFSDVGTAASPLTLPATGNYTLLLEGYIGDTGSGSYSFTVTPEGNAPPPAFMGTPLSVGNLVAGTLAANTTNAYIFTLATAARLVFDTQTNSPNLNWTLQGPSGVVVSQRGFNASDGPSGFSLLDLPAGNYQLLVRGNAGNFYQFRLLDLAAAAPLTLGTPVNGTLAPATAAAAYQFALASSGEVYFNYQSSSNLNNTYVRLVDSYGNTPIAASLFGDAGPLALAAGTYTLLVDGYFNDSGNGTYAFDMAPVTDGLQALSLGVVVNGAIAMPGQRQQYTFTLPAAARLYFDALTNNSNLRWSLEGPTNNVVNNRSFNASDAQSIGSPLLPLAAGNYTLTVTGSGHTTGAYQFRLFDLATAAPLTLGTPVNGALNPANATVAYQFTLAAAGRVFFNYQSSSGLNNTYVRLVDAYGDTPISQSLFGDAGPLALGAGTYTLLIEGYIGDTGSGSYTFNVVPVTDGLQALSLGGVVNGAIAMPGQRQQYTFTLPAAARLYFDALTNNSNLRWSLDGPTNNVVNNRGFNASDAQSIGSPLLPLAAGNYTLTVTGSGHTTGPYQFRLFDLATAAPLTLGAPVNGTLNPANATVAYQFTLASAGKVFFNYQSSSGLNNTYVRLVDAYGNTPIAGSLSSDAGPLTLAAGTYTLLIEGYIGDTGSGNYAFDLAPVTDGMQALSLGVVVNGAVAMPGQRQQYTFSLPAGARLYFDALTNTCVFNWRLDGPTGNVLGANNTMCIGTDWAQPRADTPLPPGNYILTVTAQGDATGSFSFRLANLADAPELYFDFSADPTPPPPPVAKLQTGWPAGGALVPGLAFSISLGAVSSVPITNLTLTGAGALSVSQSFTNGGPYNLTFQLPAGAAPGSTVNFTASALDGLGRASAPATLSLSVVAATGQASPVVYYSRLGGTNGQLWAAALDGSFDAPLITGEQPRVSPNGRYLAFHKDNPEFDQGNVYVLDLQTGNIRLLFANNNYVVGYGWTPDSARLVFDYSCDIQVINLDGSNNHGLLNSSCYDDAPAVNPLDGRVAFQNTQAGGGIGLANSDGTGGTFITNTVPGDVWPAWSADGLWISFQDGTNYFKIHPDGSGLARLTSVPAAGDGFNGPGAWTPDGTHLVAAGKYNGVNALYLIAADGSKTVTAIPTAAGAPIDFVGSVVTVPASAVPFAGTPLTESLAVNGSFAPANSAAAWNFSAQAGQVLSFQPGANSGFTAQGAPHWQLQDPLGNVLFDNSFTDPGPVNVPVGGDYILLVYGAVSETAPSASFNFQVQLNGNLQPGSSLGTPLVPGLPVNGSVSPSQPVNYSFTLDAPTRLSFDALTQNSQIQWTLTGAAEDFVDNRSFDGSDSSDISDSSVALPAGQYQLAVSTTGTTTNAYQFQLLDFAAATAFTPGTVVSNTLSPADATVLYQFSGTAGQSYYFDGLPSTGFTYQPYCRLYGPLGNILFSQSVNANVDTFTLAQSGIYTLTVEGRVYDTQAGGSYAFNLVPETYPTNALTLGATVTGVIPVPGQRQVYPFTLPAAAKLYFDVLTNADFYWRLDAPWGQVVNWRSFTATDGADISDPSLPLPAGAYTLTVAGDNFAVTGGYQFRLLNFAAATAFTPGTVVSNTLSPADATVFYQFSGTAGQSYYFDGLPSAGFAYQPYCRLYGPLGNILFSQSVNADVDTFTLAQSGTYTLTVEGRVYDTHAAGSYAFNLVPETYPTNALTLGATVTGLIPVPGQRQVYTFILPAAATVYFDALTNADFYWRLDASWGQVVDWRSFTSSDSADIADPSLPLPAGAYTLTVAGDNFAVTGGYQFRLLDFAAATAFTPGTVVSNTLSPADATVLYQFNGTAGQSYYFDGLPSAGFAYQPYCRLYGPLGNILFSQSVNANVDTFTLAQSGIYTLTVEGRVYDTQAGGAYAFDLVPDPPISPQPLFPTNVAPDLVVSAVSVLPAGGLQSGAPVTVQWTDANTGTGTADGSFTDRVTIRNAATSLVLVDTFLPYAESDPGNGPIAPGTNRARQLTVSLPDGTNSTGVLQVTVTTDALNSIAESNEANNSTSVNVTATLAPYPDLLVAGISNSPPTRWLPGSTVAISWVVTNSGAGSADTNWMDSVVVLNTNTAQVIFSANTNYNLADPGNGSITPGGFRTRTISFTMPTDANAYGVFAITVTTDSGNQVFEYNPAGTAELNNSTTLTVISAPDLVVQNPGFQSGVAIQSGGTYLLTWNDVNAGTVDTGGGFSDQVIVRNTGTAAVLFNNGVAYNPNAPGNGPIAPGGSLARSLSVHLPDGAPGAGNLQISVTTDAQNQLLEINPEGTGEANNTALFSVVSSVAPYPDLQVVNLSVQPSRLASGANVTIHWQDSNTGNGAASGNWYDQVTVVNTNSGATIVNANVFYDTNSLGPLTNGTARDRSYGFTLPNGSNGFGGLLITVTADVFNNIFEYNTNGTAELNNSTAITVLSTVAPYPDLQVVNLSVQPDPPASGTNLTINWQDTNSGNASAVGNWYDRVTVLNTNTGATLLDTNVYYNTNIFGVLTNGTARNLSLSFTLPNGSNGAGALLFTVTADTLNNIFEYNSAGTGESNNSDSILLTSALTPLPDLVITSLVFTNSVLSDQSFTAQIQLANLGLADMGNTTIMQRLFISATPTPGSGTFAALETYTGGLTVNQSVTETFTLDAPSTPGNYWLIAQADANDSVLELSKDNNFRVSSTPLVVQPKYTATVTADIHKALANTPIPMHGLATLGGGGGPAAFVPVTIHVQVRGTDRTTVVLTAADGSFTNLFVPLPNEAGDYQISAALPEVTNPPAQDSFTLIGMIIAPVGLVDMIEGTTTTNSTHLDNLSDVPLDGLSITVLTNQANLKITASLATNALSSFADVPLQFVITATDASIYQSPVVLQVTSSEGAVATLTIIVRVEALRPQLVASPGTLQSSMLLGAQTPLAFTLSNSGGAATGPLQVVLPNQPWLALASAAQLPPLAPGSNTVITLLLTPASDLPLGNYSGSLVVQSTNAALQVPYAFRAISDAMGNMVVTAQDEYTFFAAGAPNVTNAMVVLSDALSGTPVITNYTAVDGTARFTNLTEAYYIVDVTEPTHSPFRQTALVPAGATTNVTAFLTRQTVTYDFTVTPTTIPDQYTFTVDSTFETQVPIPVVTIDPSSLDLSSYPGTEFQVLFTVSNHGLIDAADVQLNIPSTDSLQLTPLITDLPGKLKAQTSLTVPVVVKRLTSPTPGKTGAALGHKTDAGSGQCSVNAQMLWNYLCGPNVVDKNTAFYVFDSTGCDLVQLYSEVYNLVPDNAGGGGGGGGGGGLITSQDYFDYLNSLQPVSDFGPPPGYHFECKVAPTHLIRKADDQADSTCAHVDIRLDQKGVLARDAFNAMLEISNDSSNQLQNVEAILQITDINGNVVSSNLFAIATNDLSGLTAIDGTGVLPANTDGTANWTIIPTLEAAPTNGITIYLVGGTLSYTQNGQNLTVPLSPAPIQVFPQPQLLVRYFHDRDVFGDDPFTPQIEPSIPYSLAVQVNNVGYGAAQALTITGGKPQIVDNIKGLIIGFTLLGTQLENQQETPSLEVNFGEIDPATNKIARWLFTSTLQGSFTNFSASFSEVNQFGNPQLSLIKSVEIHELSHIVDAGGPFEDGRPDFLVNDIPNADHLPDTLYLSDGTITNVSVVTNVTVTGALSPANLSVQMTAAPPAGWTFFQFADPGAGQYVLSRVVRADNSEVPFGTNVWTADRIFLGGDLVPIITNLVRLFDYNSSGSYTLFYNQTNTGGAPDTIPPTSAVAALPSSSPPNFTVQWSGTDNPGGSGVANFNIYVAINGGPFTPWITNTTQTASLYNGATNSTYAFFSQATDAAGNQEALHPTADAQTSVTAQANTPPVLAPIPAQTLAAGALFTLSPNATDANQPPPVLTWSLLPGAPPNALISSTSGFITWQTGATSSPTNTFTLVVSDNGSPSLSATQTFNVVLTRTNQPPVITSFVPFANASPFSLLSIQLSATDPDQPARNLTWTLGAGAPAGLAINPATGLLTWTPTLAQSSTTNSILIIVQDGATPPLSASNTLRIVVGPPNHPPVLAPIADHFASVPTPLVIATSATDPDIPANILTFSLGLGAPAGAGIDPNTGVFTWTPTLAQAQSTNLITVIVTDNGLPPLSATQQFTVVVRPAAYEFALSFGSANVLAGGAGSVPITLRNLVVVTNLTATLDTPAGLFTSLALGAPAPAITAMSLQPNGANQYQISFTLDPTAGLLGTNLLASLDFVTAPGGSAVAPLTLSRPAGLGADGLPIEKPTAESGRVIIVGQQPVLDPLLAPDLTRALQLYGRPGASYGIQYSFNPANPAGWIDLIRLPMTNLFAIIPGLAGNGPQVFYRAYELVAATPILEWSPPGQHQTLLAYGVPGLHYSLQYSTNLSSGAWYPASSYTLTNSFLFLPALPNTNSAMFYRLQAP